MTPDRWRRIQTLFAAAEEFSSGERGAFLDQACADDPEMRAEIHALLQWRVDAGDFLNQPAAKLLNLRQASVALCSVQPSQGEVDLAGRKLGRYEILERIGMGGMGIVYKARDKRLGRLLALKVLPAAKVADQDRKLRFVQEARAASALNHPNIITIYEIGEADDTTPYIAMEYIEGRAVRQLIADGDTPLKSVLAIAVQIADGLSAAHEHGIVHRDLKPENIMVDGKERTKILDFGIAKFVAANREPCDATICTNEGPITQTGILGTVNYMSPEQASRETVDFRSDQFSLGVLLYEMVTSKRPFEGASAAEILAAIVREQPIPVVRLNQEVPQPLQWIIERCLAKKPADRYGSTRELAQDLALVRDHLSEASLKTRGTAAPALPATVSSIVGRETDIVSVRSLFREGVRLLTLTGPGGNGKTRLALEIVKDLDKEYAGGVYFLALASVSRPELVVSTIAQAFGVWAEPGKPLPESVREQLASSLVDRTLLVLDNFEHVQAAAPFVGELLAACTRLEVLVTSREPLHIYGEQEFPVLPLRVPDIAHLPSFERICEYPALVLFVQRAKAAKPSFALDNENAAAIARVCARLDGLPLAIELAAPAMKMFSASALLARLDDPLHAVMRTSSDAPARHQSLRRAIEWSYDLLRPEEQKLFRRLSVFLGGCTLEAAEAVCAAYEDLGIDLLDGLVSLLDKSLVQQSEQADSDSRFTMLETIRAYAAEQLRLSGEEAATLRAHAAYCLILAEDGNKDFGGNSPNAIWLNRFDLEHANFRKAMDWLAETENAEWGMRLGAALGRFWEVRESFAESSAHMRILNLPAAQARTKLRARSLFAASFAAGDLAVQCDLKSEMSEIYRELGDKHGMLVGLNAIGVFNCEQGNYDAARLRFQESVGIARELNDRLALAHSLSNLGTSVKLAGEASLARLLYQQSLALFREVGDRAGIACSFNYLGDLALDEKHCAKAESFYHRAITLFGDMGDRWGIAHSLLNLGNAARDGGDHKKAGSFYKDSLKMFQTLGRSLSIAQVLEAFVCCAAAAHQSTCALTLAGAAAALRRHVGVPTVPHDQLLLEFGLESARRETGYTVATLCWNEGWGMQPDKAVEYALAI